MISKTAIKIAGEGTKGVKMGTVNVVMETTSLGTKGLIKSAANPVGIASDPGLEFAGYKEEGKMVGKCDNIVFGAMMGGVIAGPAVAGFAVWVVGEVTGGPSIWRIYKSISLSPKTLNYVFLYIMMYYILHLSIIPVCARSLYIQYFSFINVLIFTHVIIT